MMDMQISHTDRDNIATLEVPDGMLSGVDDQMERLEVVIIVYSS
jgi:hypothetical protein